MENDAAVSSLALFWLLMKDLMPFSRRKDFKFLKGKDQIKGHCLYHFKMGLNFSLCFIAHIVMKNATL